MSESPSEPNSPTQTLRDRYLALIDQIVQTTLKGQIRSKEQVYQMLVQQVSPGTGEIFERCLDERESALKQQLDTEKDELKQAKATRSQRALKTIRGEWERAALQNQVAAAIATAVEKITTSDPADLLSALLQAIDPNQKQVLSFNQLKQLASSLASSNTDQAQELQQLALGITRGLESWQRLESYLVSWLYDAAQGSLGFEGTPEQRGPWALWAKQVGSPTPQALFHTLSLERSLVEWAAHASNFALSDWVELAVVMQYLQRGLVAWTEQRIYDAKLGSKFAISCFLSFTAIWCELANGFNQAVMLNSNNRERLAAGCFQITLQILRSFAQKQYFPLYGGIFASFSGGYLSSTLDYLDVPLGEVEGTQEKARIFTLLGYSQRALGNYERATDFHEQALAIARSAGDMPCEIANLNHLSRTCVAKKLYSEAINYSQRALLLSRQAGEKLGEANALANLGYSEVFSAQALERLEPELYETAINYLQQGLQLSEQLGDRQSQALCFSSLGTAYLVLSQPQAALNYLQSGFQTAQTSGDLYLQGLNLVNLAEAYYSLQQLEQAIYTGCLGMYMLEQIASVEWRQAAGLLSILQGQIGRDSFQKILEQYRTQIMNAIGVDGYDYLPQLLEQYQREI
jgi:tetratricopeptide (TPR) repeat protein